METAFFVSVEHLRSEFKASKLSNFLISNSHKVECLSYDMIHQTRVRVGDSGVNEVTEVFSVLVISIVDKLHL